MEPNPYLDYTVDAVWHVAKGASVSIRKWHGPQEWNVTTKTTRTHHFQLYNIISETTDSITFVQEFDGVDWLLCINKRV
jgi:hypothetical protein